VNGAIASGDFTQGSFNAVTGTYTLNGSPATLEDIIDLSAPDNNFDPLTDMDAGGVKAVLGTEKLVLKNPLSSQVAVGFTLVFDVYVGTPGLLRYVRIQLFNSDYSQNAYASSNGSGIDLFAINEEELIDNSGIYAHNADSINRVAFTVVDDAISASLNGGVVASLAHGGVNANTAIIYFEFAGDADTRLRAFAFYDPVSDASLPAFSAL